MRFLGWITGILHEKGWQDFLKFAPLMMPQWGLHEEYEEGCPDIQPPGPCLNIKTVFSRYGDSHVKDKTVARPSYLWHGDPYTGKTTSLYWKDPLCLTLDETSHFHILYIAWFCKVADLWVLSLWGTNLFIGWKQIYFEHRVIL